MPTHDSVVKTLAEHLQSSGFSHVTADVDGYDRPTKIVWTKSQEGHIPDAQAKWSGNEWVFEVETDDCISDGHTESQFRLFDAYCRQHGGTFCVVVPKATEPTARQVLGRLGVTVEVWTIG